MSSSEQPILDVEAAAKQLADELASLVQDGQVGSLDADVIRRLFATSLRVYVASLEAGTGGPAFVGEDEVTATEAAVAAERLLHAADLNPFELTMWSTLGSL